MKKFIIVLLALLCFTGCSKKEAAQPATVPATTVPVTEPAETEPAVTEPAETEPAETKFTVQLMGDARTAAVVYAIPSLEAEMEYRWYADGQWIPTAVGDFMTVPLSAFGKQITVTATYDGYTAESAPVTIAAGATGNYPMSAIAHDAKLYGRCGLINGISLDFSASGLELSVESKGNPMNITYRADYDAYVVVYVDGMKLERRLLSAGDGTLSIPLSAGVHTVMLLKETEVQTSEKTLQLLRMEFDGNILDKPADRSLYIEFIGDSIACGDGALGKYVSGQKWSLEDHSGTNGFAYLTAQQLGADWSVFARGGIGLVKPAGAYTAGQMFPYVNLYRDKQTKYTPTRIPDIVVVELGANDDKNDTSGFVAAYTALVEQIRALYGEDVKIVWTGKNYNQYNSALYVAKERGDANMFAFQFQYGGSGSAALETQSAGHPDAAEQKEFANALSGYLRKYVLTNENS